MDVSPISRLPFSTMFLRRLLVGLGLAALFAWLALRQPPGTDPRLVEREFLAMGTIISASLYLDPGQPRDAGEAALRDLEDFLRAYEARWSAWGTGALGQLNQALARGETVTIPPALQPLFSRAAALSAASGGRFDVRIGRLVELWGFHDETRFRSEPPTADAVAAAVHALQAAPPLDAAAHSYGPARAVWLDFGAIAKGDATDLAIERLRSAGFAHAIVNLGGNLRVAGRRGDRPWRIGVRHPRVDAQHRVLASLETSGDEAVVTSGDYERYFEFEGRRYHHLLDPHSGYPATGLQAVTVVAADGALADAASTALFVAGPLAWRETARALGIDQAFVVEADGRIVVTAALARRIRFADDSMPQTVP
ncbi:FAD:protein FMN transferase [Fontimonas sp. SYSU GA230001]|uniref:FAD:protein FMN transferase n=1 Tax=Fontimonas sp. SYSU GA230001 TaxID=3142450 RepID=UPI0032B4F721